MIELNMYLAVLAGLLLLSFCSEWLVQGAVQIGKLLRISAVFVGVVVIGFGTSLPEILTTFIAASKGESSLGVGNIIGSNIANIGLILGVAFVLFGKHRIKTEAAKFDYGMMLIATLLLNLIAVIWGYISVLQASLLLLAMVVIFSILLHRARKTKIDIDDEDAGWAEASLKTVVGLFGLWAGAELLVGGAISIASAFNVPSSVIGLSMVAIGTSLPELAATIAAARKLNCGLILGNVMGSNMLNIFAALGLGGLLVPLQIAGMERDIIVMVLFSVSLLPLFIWRNIAGIGVGVVFLVTYASYMAYIYTQT